MQIYSRAAKTDETSRGYQTSGSERSSVWNQKSEGSVIAKYNFNAFNSTPNRHRKSSKHTKQLVNEWKFGYVMKIILK